MATEDHTLISDFLKSLKVPFTRQYTKQRFESMSFKTLFGVSNLLKEYGVETTGYRYKSTESILSLSSPFIAQTKGGLIIVIKVNSEKVNYLTQGVVESMPYEEFVKVWTGIVLTAKVLPHAKEPDYGKHCRSMLINNIKKYLFWILGGLLLSYLLVTNGEWKFWSVWALIAIDGFGLWLTYMLVQKSLKIKNHVADKVCGVLQEGGCDSILKTSASSFFGIFSWSEVGFTYFGVSLLAILISPHTIHWLSIINICCLPFTLWSIWYQKFIAKHWCTLCVCVQLSLWLQFVCYLFGHWQAPIFPLDLGFFALCSTFIFVLLGINRILPHFTNNEE